MFKTALSETTATLTGMSNEMNNIQAQVNLE